MQDAPDCEQQTTKEKENNSAFAKAVRNAILIEALSLLQTSLPFRAENWRTQLLSPIVGVGIHLLQEFRQAEVDDGKTNSQNHYSRSNLDHCFHVFPFYGVGPRTVNNSLIYLKRKGVGDVA